MPLSLFIFTEYHNSYLAHVYPPVGCKFLHCKNDVVIFELWVPTKANFCHDKNTVRMYLRTKNRNKTGKKGRAKEREEWTESRGMLCNALEEWNEERRGRLNMEGIYIKLCLICIVVWQKTRQHCTAISHQLKKRKRKKIGNLLYFQVL